MSYDVGGSNLAIGISLIMRDGFSNQAHRASVAMDDLERKAESLRRQQLTMARDMNATGAAIGLAATRGMGQWYREGAQFGYTMKYVASLAGGSYDELSAKATRLGEATIFTAQQVSDGMRWMAQSGMQNRSILNSIGSITDLATATLTDIAGRGGAADWITNISKAFKIPLENEQNVARVSDIVAASVNKANLTLYDYGEAMKYAQSTAATLGVTLEEVSAGIMVMGNAGMQGSMAGTAFENAIRYFSKAIGSSATKRQTNALAMLGLSPADFKDANGDMVSYGQIISKIGEAVKGLKGNVAAQGAIVDIFGVRGGRNASLLIRSLGDYKQFLDELNNSEGYAAKIAKGQMATGEGSILQLISTWQTFKVKFSEAIEPMIDPLVNGLRVILTIFNKLMSTSSGQKMAMIAAGYVVIRTAVMSYRAVVMTMKLAHQVLGSSLAAQTGTVVNSYNAMTGAANRYKTASMGAGLGGIGTGIFSGATTGTRAKMGKWAARRGLGTFTGTAANGALYTMSRGGRSRFVPKGSNTGFAIGSLSGALGKFGNFANKASLPAMLAGMGLGVVSDAVGSETAWGKGFGVAGDTLGYAGTGAMLGSIIPGVGTAVGALVGGVGGLLYSLTQRLNDTTDELKDQKDKMTGEFDKKDWLRKVELLKTLAPGQEALIGGPARWNFNTGELENPFTKLVNILGERDKDRLGNIIINIDGQKKFQEQMTAMQYKNVYNLGI